MEKYERKNSSRIRETLERVAHGELSVDDATLILEIPRGFQIGQNTSMDTDRVRRLGIPEVIYGEGKSCDQVVEAVKALREVEQTALVTRIRSEHFQQLMSTFPNGSFSREASCMLVGEPLVSPQNRGAIAVVSAGTSDLAVAAEITFCLRAFGNQIVHEYRDVGVSGIHRTLDVAESLRKMEVVIVVAGFEAALPSVLGGLIDRPILAVPTSIGYGTGFKGLSAVLGMLNTCAPGVAVFNIDNGFGAAFAATLINRGPR